MKDTILFYIEDPLAFYTIAVVWETGLGVMAVNFMLQNFLQFLQDGLPPAEVVEQVRVIPGLVERCWRGEDVFVLIEGNLIETHLL